MIHFPKNRVRKCPKCKSTDIGYTNHIFYPYGGINRQMLCEVCDYKWWEKWKLIFKGTAYSD